MAAVGLVQIFRKNEAVCAGKLGRKKTHTQRHAFQKQNLG